MSDKLCGTTIRQLGHHAMNFVVQVQHLARQGWRCDACINTYGGTVTSFFESFFFQLDNHTHLSCLGLDQGVRN